ncbi:MAG: hypothetical protein WC251_01810 [Candidatus Izemoplasmatales bacterium]|jgi:hypothetical protein
MLFYGGIGLSEIVKTENRWTRNVEFNLETVAVVTGGGKSFHVGIRWKKYSMTVDVLKRITELVGKLDRETGEVVRFLTPKGERDDADDSYSADVPF